MFDAISRHVIVGRMMSGSGTVKSAHQGRPSTSSDGSTVTPVDAASADDAPVEEMSCCHSVPATRLAAMSPVASAMQLDVAVSVAVSVAVIDRNFPTTHSKGITIVEKRP